ncbi:hypothetical protein [Streptococcus halichoeri]|uniref:hypothetical protein n=1 Tax=Streptococcus halichoeri TaxID=254785 RepID=UPI000DAFE107|nr:hypothetical protein [Streptococcus halichoeri]PZO95639.1 MAG: hypothetical protein DI617_03125 [Streptococcus pyogenes]
MLKIIRNFGNKYSHFFIGTILVIWGVLIFLPIQYLGGDYTLRNNILLNIFPIIGVFFIIFSVVCRNIKYLVLGICLLFAFYLTMLIGYAFLGN